MNEVVTNFSQSFLAIHLNQLKNALRMRHYSYETEKAYVYWRNFFSFLEDALNIRTIQALLGCNDVEMTKS